MKKSVAIISTILAIIVFTLMALISSVVSAAAPNNFQFESMTADYYLDRDAQNHSTVRVREQLVAQFPASDQNHGIERAIPEKYDGHSVNVQLMSVKDNNGADLPYSTYSSNDNLVVRVGEAGTYVHGTQNYILNYTMQDVTKKFDSGDEFYWDVNGTGWQQPFDSVIARLHLNDQLASVMDRESTCFTGAQGSTARECEVTTIKNGNETVVGIRTTAPLGPGQTLSMVNGFAAGTFAEYVKPPTPWWQIVLFIVAVIVAMIWYVVVPVVAFVRAFKRWRATGRDQVQQGTIVPQYAPPVGISVLMSDVLKDERLQSVAVSATIIDLAVRGYAKVYQTGKKDYEIELTRQPGDLMAEEQQVVTILFGANPQIGQRMKLKNKDDLYTKVAKLGKTMYQKAITDGFMVDTQATQRRMNLRGIVLLTVSAFTLSILGTIAGIAVILFAYKMPARTARGVELRDYLLGTRDYMQLAEADRMKVLQSVQGAERIDTSDGEQMIKFYEKLLPLAMLFGIEKSWAKQFASLYQQPPDWYAGNWTTFNAGVFASSLSDFGTNVTANSFTAPSSSNSSGFSGSGGFSGGGGGGGGGGGW